MSSSPILRIPNLPAGSTTGQTLRWDATKWVANSDLIVADTGNVGIGTSTPAQTLTVAKTGDSAKIGIEKLDADPDRGKWRLSASATSLQLQKVSDAYINTSAYALFTDVSGNVDYQTFSTLNTERLRITSTGRVGIGTTAPQTLLHVSGGTVAGGIRLEDSSASIAAPSIEVLAKRSDNNASMAFAGKIKLGAEQTTAPTPTSKLLGATFFGGNFEAGGDILYPAFIGGRAESTWSAVGTMPTALVFQTGVTGFTGDETSGGPIERMRITSTGNVGIGFNAPPSRLSVSTTDFYSLVLRRQLGNPAGGSGIAFGTDSGTIGAYLTGTGQGELVFGKTDNYLSGNGSDTRTERARIDASGNLLVGTTSATLDAEGVYLQPLGIMNATRDGGSPINANRLTSTGAVFQARFNGAAAGQITTDGTNLTFGTGSDIALKENVQPLENQLEKILALRPVKFEWKASGEMGQGFVAQEVEGIYPDNVVDGESDMAGYKMLLGMDKNYARLVKAIQEQQAMLTELNAKVDALT